MISSCRKGNQDRGRDLSKATEVHVKQNFKLCALPLCSLLAAVSWPRLPPKSTGGHAVPPGPDIPADTQCLWEDGPGVHAPGSLTPPPPLPRLPSHWQQLNGSVVAPAQACTAECWCICLLRCFHYTSDP